MADDRVTPEDLEALVDRCYYFTAEEGVRGMVMYTPPTEPVTVELHPRLKLLTICVLVLKNGFIVTGESSCVSLANYDKEVGQLVARGSALDKLWPIAGYELLKHLNGGEA